MTYNLFDDDKKIIEKALNILAQTYDQHGFKNPKNIFRIRDKVMACSTVQLITDTSKRTFSDEA